MQPTHTITHPVAQVYAPDLVLCVVKARALGQAQDARIALQAHAIAVWLEVQEAIVAGGVKGEAGNVVDVLALGCKVG